MKQLHRIAVGTCVLALAVGAEAVLAQGMSSPTSTTAATYQAAQSAGASAQKVAPPNLVLPADMGGGTWGQHYRTSQNTGAANGTAPSGGAGTNGTGE